MSFCWHGLLGSHSSLDQLGIYKKKMHTKQEQETKGRTKTGGGKKMDCHGYLWTSKYESLHRGEGSLCCDRSHTT